MSALFHLKMSFDSISIVTYSKISFFSETEKYFIAHMSHVFFINSCIDGHLHGFHIMVMMNNSALNSPVFLLKSFQFSFFDLIQHHTLWPMLASNSHQFSHLSLLNPRIIAMRQNAWFCVRENQVLWYIPISLTFRKLNWGIMSSRPVCPQSKSFSKIQSEKFLKIFLTVEYFQNYNILLAHQQKPTEASSSNKAEGVFCN